PKTGDRLINLSRYGVPIRGRANYFSCLFYFSKDSLPDPVRRVSRKFTPSLQIEFFNSPHQPKIPCLHKIHPVVSHTETSLCHHSNEALVGDYHPRARIVDFFLCCRFYPLDNLEQRYFFLGRQRIPGRPYPGAVHTPGIAIS